MNIYNELGWDVVPPVTTPSDDELEIIRRYLHGSVLLLGHDEALLPFCTRVIDPELPSFMKLSPSCQQAPYDEITEHYDVIMGNDAINMCGGDIIPKLIAHCDTLVLRFFEEQGDDPHLQDYKYFKSNTPLILPDALISTRKNCLLLVYRSITETNCNHADILPSVSQFPL